MLLKNELCRNSLMASYLSLHLEYQECLWVRNAVRMYSVFMYVCFLVKFANDELTTILCLFLVTGLSFNTDSVDIVLCHTESEVPMATLCCSGTVHYWHWVSYTG